MSLPATSTGPFLDNYRHYLRYNRTSRSVRLDDNTVETMSLNNSIKHFYLPHHSDYGIYIAGKPAKDRRFARYRLFRGCISSTALGVKRRKVFEFLFPDDHQMFECVWATTSRRNRSIPLSTASTFRMCKWKGRFVKRLVPPFVPQIQSRCSSETCAANRWVFFYPE